MTNQSRDLIISKLNSIRSFPSLSDTMLKLIKKLGVTGENRDVNFEEIASIIEMDIGLSARVLQIANSAQYTSRYGRIGDVKHAISRMGLDLVFMICLSVSAIQIFPDSSHCIDISDFWRHSVLSAMVVRIVSDKTRSSKGMDNNSYVAGLFHDIGIFIFDRYFNETYSAIQEEASEKMEPAYIVEKEKLGIDHGEIGAILLKKWQFPEDIINAVQYHHFPYRGAGEYASITRAVHLSDFICSSLGYFEPGNSRIGPQDCSISVWDDSDFEIDDMEKIINFSESAFKQANEFVEISI